MALNTVRLDKMSLATGQAGCGFAARVFLGLWMRFLFATTHSQQGEIFT